MIHQTLFQSYAKKELFSLGESIERGLVNGARDTGIVKQITHKYTKDKHGCLVERS
jgi:hypothetical protein